MANKFSDSESNWQKNLNHNRCQKREKKREVRWKRRKRRLFFVGTAGAKNKVVYFRAL
jgi:hypothetical protein